MKKLILIAALLLPLAASAQLPWMKGKTPVPYRKDTVSSAPATDTTPAFATLPATVTFTLDTTLEAPSYYLRQSANAHNRELLFGVLSGGFVTLAALDESSRGLCIAGAAICGVAAIVNYFSSSANLKKAGRSLSRLHVNAGGVAIDL